MNRSSVMLASALLVLSCSALGGCETAATGQQFIPPSAESIALNQLATIELFNHGNQTPQDLALNGEKIRKNRIHLTPGQYVLTYRMMGISEEWEAVAMDRLAWRSKSRELNLEAGKTYPVGNW